MDRSGAHVLQRMTKHIQTILTAIFITGSLAAGAAPAVAATHRHHHHRSHHAIPQHNRGDRDGDNNGGHDDRDGDL